MTTEKKGGSIDRRGVIKGGERVLIKCTEGDRAVELYKEEPGRGATENQRETKEECQPNREGMLIDVEGTRQPEIQNADTATKEKGGPAEGGVHTIRVPLADCTNISWPICEVMEQKQHQGHKGQWKRRARRQVAESKEDPSSDHGGEALDRMKRVRGWQEENSGLQADVLVAKKSKTSLEYIDTTISEVEETSREWSQQLK